MKKIISLVLALVVCAALVGSASATNGGFVPSITYKPGPELVPIPHPGGGLPSTDKPIFGVVYDDDSGAKISLITEGCLVVTPLAMVDSSQEIPAEAAEEMKWLYQQLRDGFTTIPYHKFGNFEGKKLVLVEMFDASWLCGDGDTDRGFYSGARAAVSDVTLCSEQKASTVYSSGAAYPAADSSGVVYLGTASNAVLNELLSVTPRVVSLSEVTEHEHDHDHPTEVRPNGVVFDLTFQTGIADDAEVVVMVYNNGDWNPAVRVSNDGDGMVSCTFEKLGIITMSVVVDEDDSGASDGDSEGGSGDSEDIPPKTGDDSNVWLWAGVMAASLAALVVIIILYRRESSGRKSKE